MRSVAALLIFATPLVAHAEPPSLTAPLPPPVEQPAVEHTSYAAYTLTADGVSIGALLGGFASEGPHGEDRSSTGPLYAIGMLGGLFATPIIHGMRGHGGRAVGSFLLRSGAASLGMVVGVSMTRCSATGDPFCALDGIGPGLVGGLIVASIIDAATMTEETVERPARWSPVIAPRSGGAMLGFAAAF